MHVVMFDHLVFYGQTVCSLPGKTTAALSITQFLAVLCVERRVSVPSRVYFSVSIAIAT